jgi:hypothetical protein
VLTGLEDDRRRLLEPSHPLYGDALAAHDEQDDWSPAEHAAFWSALLVAWPRAGRPPAVDHLSAAAAHMASFGVPLDVIAETLGVEPDTLRARQPSRLRERPSVERGAELLELDPLGVRLRRQLGTLVQDAPPLPRVYADDEERARVHPLQPAHPARAGIVAATPGRPVVPRAGRAGTERAARRRPNRAPRRPLALRALTR